MGLPFTREGAKEADKARVATAKVLPLAYPWWRLFAGLLAVVLITIFAASLGSVQIPPFTIVQILASKIPILDVNAHWPDSWSIILWELRLPRIVLAGLVGASLAIAGATYQGLFRNPLADPYLIGVAAGAGLGATVILVTKIPIYFHGFSLLPITAFAGALLAVTVAYLVARQSGGFPLATLLLSGVAVAFLASAVTSLLIIRSDPDVKPLLGWLLGGFVGTQWKDTLILLPYMIPGVVLMMAYGRILNMFQITEEEAKYLGVNVDRAKVVLIAVASLVTAAAVSVSGLIGFVGLIAPHAVRLIWGPGHRFLLPMSMLIGAGFLILADLVARTVVSPSELPVGVITAFCGAPFFLYLLRRSRKVIS